MSDSREGVALSECPSCHYKFDSATHLRKPDVRPKPGDFSICIECGELLRFTELMTVERLSNIDIKTLYHKEPQVYDELLKCSTLIMRQRFNIV